MRYASVLDLPPQMREQAERQLVHTGNTVAPAGCVDPHAKKPSKYRNVRVEIDGETYDSKLEYEKHMRLKLRESRGEIMLILRQVPFRLEGGVVYKADFLCITRVEPFVEIWDAKGCDTRSSINKRKQVLARYGIEVRLWRREDRGTP